MDKVAGHLEVGTNGRGEVVINHPEIRPDAEGAGHIVLSPRQARELAEVLRQKAFHAEYREGIGGTVAAHVAAQLAVEERDRVAQAEAQIAAEDERDRALRDTPERRAIEAENARRSRLSSEDPDHTCGLTCDGQDSANSYCARLRRKLGYQR